MPCKIQQKIILMIGTAICLLAMGSYLFASTVFLLLAVRILHGAGFGITTTTYGTVVSDLIPQARRGEGMGYFGLSGTIAMALGPLIGLWLMQTYNFTILFMCTFLYNCFININETTSNQKIAAITTANIWYLSRWIY